MSTINMGLAFYRQYYQQWDFDKKKPFGKNDPEWLGVELNWKEDNLLFNPDYKTDEDRINGYFRYKNNRIEGQKVPANPERYHQYGVKDPLKLVTVYPGLLLGTGYAHGIGQQGEAKIGFYFDYTTGLPVIPGSGIKGALRSAFPGAYYKKAATLKENKKEEEASEYELQGDARVEYLQFLLQERLGLSGDELTKDFIESMELEMFEGIWGKDAEGKPRYMPMTERDVFYDAFISGSVHGSIMGSDFITPHKNPKKDKDGIPDEMKNPVPIQFAKVLPGVEFTFSFRLQDQFTDHEGKSCQRKLEAVNRLKLLEAILLDIGVGAKTNVGYGQFLSPEDWKKLYSAAPERSHEKEANETRPGVRDMPKPPIPKPLNPPVQKPKTQLPEKYHHPSVLIEGCELVGIIYPPSKRKPDTKRIQFMVNGETYELTSADIQQFEIGDLVEVMAIPSSTGGVSGFINPKKI